MDVAVVSIWLCVAIAYMKERERESVPLDASSSYVVACVWDV